MAHRPPESRTGGPDALTAPASSPAPLLPFAADRPAALPSLAPIGLPDAGKPPPRRPGSATSVHTLETNGRADPGRIVERDGFWSLSPSPGIVGERWFFIPAGTRGRAFQTPEQNEWRAGDPEIPPASDAETSWRHAWWADERRQVRGALARLGTAGRALERWDNCGSDCWVRVHKQTGDLALSANTCRHRWCKPCGISRANLIAGNLAAELKRRRFQRFAHIVLTLKSTGHPLRDQRAHIYRAFRALRKIRLGTVPRARERRGRVVNWWSSWVHGGAAFFEVTLNDKPGSPDYGRFHCHLHVIAQSRWLPREDLASLWSQVTRDDKRGFPASSVVWVERIDDAGGAAAEVSKYAAKGIDSTIAAAPNKLDELIGGMKGARLCFTFGAWRGFKLTETPEFDPADWVSLGRLEDHLKRAAAGDDRSGHILAMLRGEKRGLQLPPPPAGTSPSPN